MKKYSLIYAALLAIFSLSSCIREDASPIEIPPIGTVISPLVGGPTQPNQVWIDLNLEHQTTNRRDAWELAFTNDKHFRVLLNSSIMMAVGEIPNAYDIDAVTESSVAQLKYKVQIADFSDNSKYIDDPSGNYATQTSGMAPVSSNDNENPVYLLNLGRKIFEGKVDVGASMPTDGQERGWMKIRVLRHQDGYKLQYAKLSETTHKEVIIKKNTAYNFQFFSLMNESEVLIQPEKNKWHFVYTVMTNLTDAGTFYTSYIFSDVVLTNIHHQVKSYMVTVPNGVNTDEYFANFKKSNVDETKLNNDDQRAIGSNWRSIAEQSTSEASVRADRFFILKDANGTYFKIRFLKMRSAQGERGYPEFEYQSL